MFARRLFVLPVAFLGLPLAVGCSRGNSNYATVSGVINHNGSPVEGAKITFHGTTEVDGKTQSYAALTDSSGKYVIAAVGKDPGMPPGLYKVTVYKLEGKGPAQDLDPGQLEAMASDLGPATKGGPINLLPKEYATVGSSKLSATLEAGKNENVNFELKGKAGQ